MLRVGIKLYRFQNIAFSFTSYIFAQNNRAFNISQKCLIWHISARIVSIFFFRTSTGEVGEQGYIILFTYNRTYVCDRCKIIEQNIK